MLLLVLLPINRYDGWDGTSHAYSYTTTEWGGTSTSITVPVSSDFEDAPHLIDDNDLRGDLSLDVEFVVVDSSSLILGDTWTILISSCGAAYALKEGMSATLTSEDGTAPVNQLTLDRGYEGTVPGSHDVYSVNQHFTVRASGEKEERR